MYPLPQDVSQILKQQTDYLKKNMVMLSGKKIKQILC